MYVLGSTCFKLLVTSFDMLPLVIETNSFWTPLAAQSYFPVCAISFIPIPPVFKNLCASTCSHNINIMLNEYHTVPSVNRNR